MFPKIDLEETLTSVTHGAAVEWVTKSLDIAFNPWNHPTLMKDDYFIYSLVYFMDEQQEKVIKKALEICYLLLQNRCNHQTLKHEQFVQKGLELAYKQYRSSKSNKSYLFMLCKESLRKLKDADYAMAMKDGPQLRDKDDEALWGDTVIYFRIPKITALNKQLIHSTLAKVPGVMAVTSCVQGRYVKVNVAGGFSTSVSKSTINTRLLIDVYTINPRTYTWDACDDPGLESDEESDAEHGVSLPSYLPDVDSPVKTRGTVTATSHIKDKASGIVSWLRDSFYW